MSEHSSGILGLGLSLAVIFIVFCIGLAIYVFTSFCYKRICRKAGKETGALIWIPIVRYIPLLQVAKQPEWLVVLLLVPLVNFVVFILMWAKVCEARGKSQWLVIMWFIPVVNIAFIPYLAFSE